MISSIKEGIHPMYPLNHPTIDPPYIGWEPAVSVYPLLTSTGKDDKNERLCTLIIASDGCEYLSQPYADNFSI